MRVFFSLKSWCVQYTLVVRSYNETLGKREPSVYKKRFLCIAEKNL